jgi:hypothetical protein
VTPRARVRTCLSVVVTGPGLENCARQNSVRENLAEYRGARDRASGGDLVEPPVAAEL